MTRTEGTSGLSIPTHTFTVARSPGSSPLKAIIAYSFLPLVALSSVAVMVIPVAGLFIVLTM